MAKNTAKKLIEASFVQPASPLLNPQPLTFVAFSDGNNWERGDTTSVGGSGHWYTFFKTDAGFSNEVLVFSKKPLSSIMPFIRALKAAERYRKGDEDRWDYYPVDDSTAQKIVQAVQ
jgi:hypothetical protein